MFTHIFYSHFHGASVRVSIDRPQQQHDGDYYCTVNIQCAKAEVDTSMNAYGVDPFQAIEAAVTIARAQMKHMDPELIVS
ncbi:DUF6968 family protein [Brevibacterium aurantiacum]|uniref:DUF6968 family protein n=1 Tax=Brevibacterium aurantiacum TaxID=273384 RepID=UPI003B97AE27